MIYIRPGTHTLLKKGRKRIKTRRKKEKRQRSWETHRPRTTEKRKKQKEDGGKQTTRRSAEAKYEMKKKDKTSVKEQNKQVWNK